MLVLLVASALKSDTLAGLLIPNSCSAFLPSSIDTDPGNLFSSGSNLNLDLANFSASASVFKPLRFGIKLSNCSKAPSP